MEKKNLESRLNVSDILNPIKAGNDLADEIHGEDKYTYYDGDDEVQLAASLVYGTMYTVILGIGVIGTGLLIKSAIQYFN